MPHLPDWHHLAFGMTQLQFHRSAEDIVLHTKIQLFDNSKYEGRMMEIKMTRRRGRRRGRGRGGSS